MGGALRCCLTGLFAVSGYLVPPIPVAFHRPAMTPTVQCILQPNTASGLPFVPSDRPRSSPCIDPLIQQLIEMCFHCALPPLRIQEHPFLTGVGYPQGRLLPHLCVYCGESRRRPPGQKVGIVDVVMGGPVKGVPRLVCPLGWGWPWRWPAKLCVCRLLWDHPFSEEHCPLDRGGIAHRISDPFQETS